MNLSKPKKDLEIAAGEIEKMKVTDNLSEFKEHWENCLFRLERSWEFTERSIRLEKGFQQWHKPYAELSVWHTYQHTHTPATRAQPTGNVGT